MRLARRTQLLDENDRLGRCGQELLLRWAEGEGLPGVLDDVDESERAGAKWMRDVTRAVADSVASRRWPGPNHEIWERLARPLRLNRLRGYEHRLILARLRADELLARMLDLLAGPSTVDTYSTLAPKGRASAERATLVKAVRRQLGPGPIDRTIASAIDAVDAYELTASLMQQAFDAVSWGLKRKGGRSTRAGLTGDPRLLRHLDATRNAIAKAVPRLDTAVDGLRQRPELSVTELLEPLSVIRDEASLSSVSLTTLLDVVMTRHARVQRAKRKGVWIECDTHWTLLPGLGFQGDGLPSYVDVSLHPLRVQNAYSFLRDLRLVTLRSDDGEGE
jgi:hypothetical protein